MGGNAFDQTEPLTPEQYTTIVQQITKLIAPLCLQLQPYIPLPQKQKHGDIDFLMTLKPNVTLQTIRDTLKIEHRLFIINNNLTANSVYMKKQVDFNQVLNKHQFKLSRFYKSYGGIGAFLGLFLPSKYVKLNQLGLVGCAYQQHIKLQFVICDQIDQILTFYDLDPQIYHKGFETKVTLFNFLRNNRFLNEKTFTQHTTKHQTKLMLAFQSFLIQNTPQNNPKFIQWQNSLLQTLKYFKKEAEFQAAWKIKLEAEQKKKSRAQKWNGMHIMNIFGVKSKDVNGFKKKFQSIFATNQDFEKYIDETSFQEIANLFSKVCQLKPIPKKSQNQAQNLA